MFVFAFVSEVLLCAIFWDLGKPVPIEEIEERERSSSVTLDVQPFDGEAEVQRRIWKAFCREIR